MTFHVNDRVTHVARAKSDPEATLPMRGTVVGVQVRYLVEWDGEQPRPITGWTPTYYYDESDLRTLREAPLLGPHGLAH